MIFVQPGTSRVGQLTISHLLSCGVNSSEIIAGARTPATYDGLPVQVRKADYTAPHSLGVAYEGVKTLILIPTMAPPAPRCVEHQNALQAAKQAGVERLLFLSLLTASPDSISAIAPFILFAENATRNSGMDWGLLRMGLYMEPVAEWVPELLKLGYLRYPVRKGSAAYVTRDDVARSLAAAALLPGRIERAYNISAPEAVTMPELAAAISAGVAKEIPFRTCSDEEFLEICLDDDPSPFIANVLLSLYKAIERGEFDGANDDVEKLTGTPAETVASFFGRTLKEPWSR